MKAEASRGSPTANTTDSRRITIFSFVEGAPLRKGGVGIAVVPMLMASLSERGHQVILLLSGDLNPDSDFPTQPNLQAALATPLGAGTFGIVRFKAWSTWGFAPSLLWRLCRHIRRADLIVLHSLYSFPVLVGYLLARLYRTPYLLWPHGVLAPVQRDISNRRKRIYDRLIARSILDRASVLVFTSAGERAETNGVGLAAPSVIVPLGIDAGSFEKIASRDGFRAKGSSDGPDPLILYLSRLNAKKGLDLLARAFALVLEEIPEARLAIVGLSDPPEFESAVRNWLQEAGVSERVVMPGLAVGDEKLAMFGDADVFVLPSQAENFGLAVFEAMASRTPVVVSETLDYAAEIEQSGAGFAVRREPMAFASAIVKLLQDSDLRRRMGEEGARMARRYSWEACAERIERTMRCVLSDQPLPVDLAPE
jgi:glycosyltransferase involved in cell wall biosynthesis